MRWIALSLMILLIGCYNQQGGRQTALVLNADSSLVDTTSVKFLIDFITKTEKMNYYWEKRFQNLTDFPLYFDSEASFAIDSAWKISDSTDAIILRNSDGTVCTDIYLLTFNSKSELISKLELANECDADGYPYGYIEYSTNSPNQFRVIQHYLTVIEGKDPEIEKDSIVADKTFLTLPTGEIEFKVE